MLRGAVRQTGGGVYRIALESGEVVEASLRGRLKLEKRTGDQVVIGDRVQLEPTQSGGFTIEVVEPRRSQIVRRGAGGRRVRVVAANIDRLMAVFAAREPTARKERIDRFLVIAEADGLEAVLVINKVDLPDAGPIAQEWTDLYTGVGYQVLQVSAVDGTGVEALTELLNQGSSVLVGPSGVGKSSLLNAVQPELGLRIGELSRKVGRGRHTTVASRMIPLHGGGLVADTPGFGDVGVWGVDEQELERCFPEFAPSLGLCRFQDCSHLIEPDCAIRAALEEGGIAESRYASYQALMGEARSTRRGG